MSSSWDEFLSSKIRTLGVVRRFWAKIYHDTPLESIFWKNHFLIIFDFWIVGLWILSAEFWFIRPNIGRSVIFSENIPIKVLSPKNAAVRTLNLLPYTIFCEFSPNSIFYNILRLGEEFFPRSSYGNYFSKSIDHAEHFHILRIFHISRIYGDIVLRRSVWNTLLEPNVP